MKSYKVNCPGCGQVKTLTTDELKEYNLLCLHCFSVKVRIDTRKEQAIAKAEKGSK